MNEIAAGLRPCRSAARERVQRQSPSVHSRSNEEEREMKTTIKWLLAGAIALSSTVMAQADPYDGARAAQRAAAAQREAEAMSNPANCFGQVDYGPPASALSPRVADVYRQA